MTAGAAEQVDRIVTLVAELSRADADGEPAPTLAAVAARHGTSESQILADVRALTAAADDPAAEWLSSLRIAQEGDRLMVASQGPFRRPIRLTVEEALALQVGLALESRGGAPLSDALRDLLRGGAEPAAPSVAAGSGAETGEDRVVAVARRCMDERRVLAIRYAGEGDREGEARLVEPHQVLAFEGRSYLVAWCREARGWRRFRADRVLEAAARDQTFAWRADFEAVTRPEEVFRPGADAAEPVAVRFSPRIARWITERYPGHVARSDGSVVVTFPVSSPGWLVRTVLEYGEDAEVLGPPPYRDVVRRALA